MNHSLLCCSMLAAASVAQVPAPPTDHHWPIDHVIHDAPGDGRLWAAGATWKASFGRDGFTYVPALAKAPRNFPLGLRVVAVRAGGRLVPFDAAAMPVRNGNRVTFDRGALREVYDLRLHEVEQTFVVDTPFAGDVEVELAIASELVDDAAPGLRFVCEHGGVSYGDAFVVRGGDKLAIDTEHTGSTLRLRVPASLRSEGDLVIDPILSTWSAGLPAILKTPACAYDATNDRYLLAWESEFSEFDHDVHTLMLDGQGVPIPGSSAPIDITTAFVEHPSVSNADESDRFLVVYSMLDSSTGAQHIHGRTRDAGGNLTLHPPAQFSSATFGGSNYACQVGVSAGTLPGSHDWLVVWSNQLNVATACILGRIVRSDGQPRFQGVMPLHNVSGQRNWDVQVSPSNGAGTVTRPGWWVVYGRSAGTNNGDVFGRFVHPSGAFDSETQFATTSADEKYPRMSSPIEHAGGQTGWLLTYERQGLAAYGKHLRQTTSGLAWQEYDLGNSFNAGRYTPTVDSDGVRFVVSTSVGFPETNQPDLTRISTLAYTGVQLVSHDFQILPGVVSQTKLIANASSGGARGRYAVAYMRKANGFKEPMFTRYSGATPGTETEVLPTACLGLQIAAKGSAAIGGALHFTLSGYGADFPAFGFGGANLNPVPICPACALGLRLDMPILVLPGDTMSVAIPTQLALIGQPFAVQGLAIGSGTCLGGLHFSDTVRFTIR